MRIVSAAQMQSIDARAQAEYGIPGVALMESAGRAAWLELRGRAACQERGFLVFLVGKGNNGGDALVMARYACIEGYSAGVLLSGPPESLGEHASIHARVAERLGIPLRVWDPAAPAPDPWIDAAAVLIDGLAGVGVSGVLREPLASMVRGANAAGGVRVAVDVPSGLGDEWCDGDPILDADLTLCLGCPKRSLYQPHARRHAGEIVHLDLPFPRDLTDPASPAGELARPDGYRPLIPALSQCAYKTRRGVVSVFGGSRGTTGAPVMTATAALHSRAGLVHLYTDEAVYSIVAASTVSVMVHPHSDLPDRASEGEVSVIGPGWGVAESRGAELVRLVRRVRGGVIDADGLTLLARLVDPPQLGTNWVLTPHPGEMARLLGVSATDVLARFTDSAIETARRFDCVVVAKSHVTHIARPTGEYAVVDGMNAAMGTGGSGDVLAGVIAGLLGGGISAWDAARAATLLHQAAGRLLRERRGFFAADELPAVIGELIDHE